MVSGLGWSGSSALTDYLSGFEDIGEVPGEFDDYRRFGMIRDHLAGRIAPEFPSMLSTYALRRLGSARHHRIRLWMAHLLMGSIRKVVGSQQLSSLPLRHPLARIWLRSVAQRRFQGLVDVERLLGSTSDRSSRLAITRTWLHEVLDMYSLGRRFVLLDQPIITDAHDEFWEEVFDPYIRFVVFRDPRDQLVQTYQQLMKLKRARPEEVNFEIQDRYREFGFGRTGLLKGIAHQINRRVEGASKHPPTPRNHNVSFERLIIRTDEVGTAIRRAMGATEAARRRSNRFSPAQSTMNIGIHSDFLSAEESRFVERAMDFHARLLATAL